MKQKPNVGVDLLTVLSIFTFSSLVFAQNKTVVVPLDGPLITDVELVIGTSSISPTGTSEAGLTINCPGGKKVLGGAGFGAARLVMVDSYPASAGS